VTAVDARAVARAGLFERYRSDGRTAWLDATGRSMLPLIPAGSRLLVEFGAQPARVGELIVFQRGDGAVTHRFVATRDAGDGRQVIAKGDGEALMDRPVAPDAVLGVVREVRLPDGRRARVPLGGTSGAVIARVSWWSGRAARRGGRVGRLMPAPLRSRAIALSHVLSRVPTRLFLALVPRLDRGVPAGRR
jgi:hypothetical protein